MNDVFKFFIDLHKWTRLITLILIAALIFPSLFIIVFLFFEEFMKFNIINILILSVIVNGLNLMLIYVILFATKKIIGLFVKKDFTSIISEFNQLDAAPSELKIFNKIKSFERDIINSCYALIMLAIGQSLLYVYKVIYLKEIVIRSTLSASVLFAILFEQVIIGGLVLGILTIYYEIKMYDKMNNEIKKHNCKNINESSTNE